VKHSSSAAREPKRSTALFTSKNNWREIHVLAEARETSGCRSNWPFHPIVQLWAGDKGRRRAGKRSAGRVGVGLVL